MDSLVSIISSFKSYLDIYASAGFNLGPSQFQNLLWFAGYDPKDPPFVTPCIDACVLPYLGQVRDSECASTSRNLTSSQLFHQLIL